MNNVRIEQQINASLENLSIVEELLGSMYEEQQIPEEVFGNVMVACTEAMLNAVNHGSKGDAHKQVTCVIERTDNYLEVMFKDVGEGFDVEALPDPTDPANLEKGNGRGIFIMKNLSDEISFEDGGSRVTMRFDFDSAQKVGA